MGRLFHHHVHHDGPAQDILHRTGYPGCLWEATLRKQQAERAAASFHVDRYPLVVKIPLAEMNGGTIGCLGCTWAPAEWRFGPSRPHFQMSSCMPEGMPESCNMQSGSGTRSTSSRWTTVERSTREHAGKPSCTLQKLLTLFEAKFALELSSCLSPGP